MKQEVEGLLLSFLCISARCRYECTSASTSDGELGTREALGLVMRALERLGNHPGL